MESTKVKVLATTLVVMCVLITAFRVYSPRGFQRYLPIRPAEQRIQVDGENWKQLLSWNFINGPCPSGWGWGDWRTTDGTLALRNDDGVATTYFTPVDHGGDFILETDVMLVPIDQARPTELHVNTRDSARLTNECGMALFGGDHHGYLRNTVNGKHYLLEKIDTGIDFEFGSWYKVRLKYLAGRISAFVNGTQVAAPTERYPSTLYGEPHLAVTNGIAYFRNVKVYAKTGYPADLTRRSFRSATSGATVHAQTLSAPGNWLASALTLPWSSGGSEAGENERLVQLAGPPHLAMTVPILPSPQDRLVKVLKYVFYLIVFLVSVYVVRHYIFTINRLCGRQRHPYLDIDTARWPKVTVLIPAHNEEEVIGEILEALLEVDYPVGQLSILPIDDRSRDATGEIIDHFAARFPDRITPYHRKGGMAGKAAALVDAMKLVDDDFVLVFDADYIPGQGLVKQLMAPFFDPEVGSVMGRVVPHNVNANLLTRMLDLERSGGYQVDQQARMNLRLVPQYGGTVGGIRVKALESVGGWRTDSLAEDTDATYRLLLGGWKTVYQNRSECYEQVPESWRSRMSQIFRWARGHNQTLMRYFFRLLGNRRTRFAERLDGSMLLGIYWVSPVMLLGWLVGSILWYLGVNKPGLIIILAVTTYSAVGNFAIFFEIATAAHIDGTRGRIKLLPFVFLGFLVSLVSVTRATLTQVFVRRKSGKVEWEKTQHNGRPGNGNGVAEEIRNDIKNGNGITIRKKNRQQDRREE